MEMGQSHMKTLYCSIALSSDAKGVYARRTTMLKAQRMPICAPICGSLRPRPPEAMGVKAKSGYLRSSLSKKTRTFLPSDLRDENDLRYKRHRKQTEQDGDRVARHCIPNRAFGLRLHKIVPIEIRLASLQSFRYRVDCHDGEDQCKGSRDETWEGEGILAPKWRVEIWHRPRRMREEAAKRLADDLTSLVRNLQRQSVSISF